MCPRAILCANRVFSHVLKLQPAQEVPKVFETPVVVEELSASQHGFVPPYSYQHFVGSAVGGTYGGGGGGLGGGGGMAVVQ